MRVKQQTLKGFECEIEDEASFREYYTKNAPLMQGHLLILKGKVSDQIKAFLEEKNAVYVDTNEKQLLTRKKRSTAVLDLPEPKASPQEATQQVVSGSSVYRRPIRSGELIEGDGHMVFFSRINSGALIESSSSIELFGIIDGLVRSDGEYLLLKEIGKGNVIFHGEELDKSHFDGRLQLVEYKQGTIVMKEI